MAKYYNVRVKKTSFRRGDLILRRVFLSSKEPGISTMGPNQESPYRIFDKLRLETFRIETLDGKAQPHPWNVKHM